MRHDRLESEAFDGEKNSLRHWPSIRHPLRVTAFMILIGIGRYTPLRIKNMLLRLTGMDVGENVSLGYGAVFDIFHPEKITIGDNTIIGANTTVLAHEALQDEFRTGPVKIGENVMIGADCTILPGVEIGDNAKISAHSLVNKDVDAGAFVGGVPIEPLD